VSTSLFDALGPLLSGANVSQLASALGIDERKAASALQVALPALVAALHRNASSADGLSSLTGALDRNHDGSVLDDVAGFLSGGGSPDGARMQQGSPDLMSSLGGLLDAKHDGWVADDLARMAGGLGSLFGTR